MGHGSLGPQGQVRIPTPSCPRPGDGMDNLSRVASARARAARGRARHGANGVERKAKSKKDEIDGNIIHLHMR